MTRTKTSTTMPKPKKEQFFIKGKDIITDADAPVVSDEFVTEDGEYRGQTVEVQSKTKLEDDHGTGNEIILRTFEFAMNPDMARAIVKGEQQPPHPQELFQSHMKGILALLWSDGLRPAEEIAPRLILSKKSDRYLIMIGAVPQLGQTILEKSQTLSEIANAPQSKTTKRVSKSAVK